MTYEVESTISLHSHTQYDSQRKGYISEQSSETCWASSTLCSMKVCVFINKMILICTQKHLEGSMVGNLFIRIRESPVINFFTHNLVVFYTSSCSCDTKLHK